MNIVKDYFDALFKGLSDGQRMIVAIAMIIGAIGINAAIIAIAGFKIWIIAMAICYAILFVEWMVFVIVCMLAHRRNRIQEEIDSSKKPVEF